MVGIPPPEGSIARPRGPLKTSSLPSHIDTSLLDSPPLGNVLRDASFSRERYEDLVTLRAKLGIDGGTKLERGTIVDSHKKRQLFTNEFKLSGDSILLDDFVCAWKTKFIHQVFGCIYVCWTPIMCILIRTRSTYHYHLRLRPPRHIGCDVRFLSCP